MGPNVGDLCRGACGIVGGGGLSGSEFSSTTPWGGELQVFMGGRVSDYCDRRVLRGGGTCVLGVGVKGWGMGVGVGVGVLRLASFVGRLSLSLRVLQG